MRGSGRGFKIEIAIIDCFINCRQEQSLSESWQDRNLLPGAGAPLCLVSGLWWSCEIRKEEWKQIFREIREITGLNIQMSPSMALLNLVKKD